MQKIPLYMLHDLKNLPNDCLQDGYHFRLFRTEEDGKNWAKLVTATDEFPNEKEAMQRFDKEFKPYLNETKKRIIFLETTDGQPVGTATAWFDTWNKQELGRLHWVEIAPEYQGKKLGRPLIAKAMKILSHYHEKAYLKTQTTSLAAIHIYNQLGFKPIITDDVEKKAWDHVFTLLGKN